MSLGLHVPHGEGKTVWFDGLTITVKVAAEQTGGSMGLFFYTPGGPEGLFVEAGEEPVPGVQVQPWSPEQVGDRLSLLTEKYGTQMLPEL
jgi:hypothetical protein